MKKVKGHYESYIIGQPFNIETYKYSVGKYGYGMDSLFFAFFNKTLSGDKTSWSDPEMYLKNIRNLHWISKIACNI